MQQVTVQNIYFPLTWDALQGAETHLCSHNQLQPNYNKTYIIITIIILRIDLKEPFLAHIYLAS